MAAKPKASIDVKIDERPAVASLKKIAGEFGKFSVGANQALELVGKAWRGMGAIANTAKEWIKLADTQALAEKQLASAMQARGTFTEESIRGLKAYASEMQKLTTVGDETILGFQKLFAATGASEKQIKLATKATLGLAEVTGSVKSAAENMAMVLSGRTSRELQKFGLTGRDVNETLQNAASLFQLAEDRANTFSGRTTQLDNAWGDFKETLGEAVTNSQNANIAMVALRTVVEQFTGMMSGESGTRIVDLFAASLLSVAKGASTVAVGLKAAFNVAADVMSGEERGVKRRQKELEDLVEVFRTLNVASAKAWASVDGGGAAPAAPGAPAPQVGETVTGGKKGASNRDLLLEIEREEEDAYHARNVNLQAILERGQAWRLKHEEESRKKVADEWRKGASEAAEEYRRSLNDLQTIAEQEARFMDTIGQTVGDTIGDHFSQMVVNIANGSMSVLQAIGGFIGGIITKLGTMLVQMGTAAVLAGTLGTVIPFLAPMTGGPAGVSAGLAAIAGGAALVAIGSAIGGASAPAGGGAVPRTANPGGGPVNTRSPNTTSPSGFWATALGGGDSGRVININVGMLIGTDERRAGRQLRDMIAGAA